ncbi:hypothetical protein ACHAWF_002564 [Thalassiosira exigua]
MKNNIFEFRSSHFRQLDGTTMGSPPVYIHAALYYVLHEIKQLLNKCTDFLLFYICWIDDAYILCNGRNDPLSYKDVEDFRILQRTVEERTKRVNFLDLTIKINDDN